jgi:hypothetical protein
MKMVMLRVTTKLAAHFDGITNHSKHVSGANKCKENMPNFGSAQPEPFFRTANFTKAFETISESSAGLYRRMYTGYGIGSFSTSDSALGEKTVFVNVITVPHDQLFVELTSCNLHSCKCR